MKLKIPPGLQFVIFAILMWVIARVTNVKHVEFEGQKFISWVIFSVGVLTGLIAVYSFKKEDTTTNPINPAKASKLVLTGIYKITRNPMYLGLLIILMAFVVRMGNLYTIPVLFFYIWYITTFQIKPEEEVLTKLFGDDYRKYYKKVRRWL